MFQYLWALFQTGESKEVTTLSKNSASKEKGDKLKVEHINLIAFLALIFKRLIKDNEITPEKCSYLLCTIK